MLDYRAWIAAGLILVACGGAYLVYLHRTRAQYTARSLTAPSQPTSQSPETLRVEGCDKAFLVKRGELIEPRVAPGSTVQQFESIYGKDTKRGRPGISTFDQNAFSIAASSSAPNTQLPPFVLVNVNQGHVVETLDGVELGIDSFGAIFRKLRDLKIEAQERIEHGDNNWTLTVSFDSACGRRYRSEYSRTIVSSPEIDRQILPPPAAPNTSPAPLRSDVFMNKMVSEYTMVLANGQNIASEGSPAQHE